MFVCVESACTDIQCGSRQSAVQQARTCQEAFGNVFIWVYNSLLKRITVIITHIQARLFYLIIHTGTATEVVTEQTSGLQIVVCSMIANCGLVHAL
jgi:hypothetical protein